MTSLCLTFSVVFALGDVRSTISLSLSAVKSTTLLSFSPSKLVLAEREDEEDPIEMGRLGI